jgi:response regulator NasT
MLGWFQLLRYLLISGSEKGGQFLRGVLSEQEGAYVAGSSGVAGARTLAENEIFDCCVINAPIAQEDSCVFARYLAEETQAQILLLVPEAQFAFCRAQLQPLGVMILRKPVGRQVLLSTLELTRTVQARIAHLQTQNQQLAQKIGDMQLIHRAKCVLIASLGMSETQAHKHLERQAMNQRITKREAALQVLKLYEPLRGG